MTDPVRLLDGGEALTLDERRALQADIGEQSPLGARHAVWGALIVKITAVSASAAAATATVGGATAGAAAGTATSGAATSLSLLALTKMAGIGAAAGVAVSTGMFFTGVDKPSAPPRPPAVLSAGPVVTSIAPPPVSTGAAPIVPSPAETAPPAASEPLPRRPGATPAAAPEAQASPAIESESQRVARARTLLRSGDAGQALALLRALERDEPRGLLAQEREALSIEALFVLGQGDSARTRAEAFLQRYPASPHAKAVRRAAGIP